MSKIKVCVCESYTTYTIKEWVEIDSEMYEETKGMSSEELQEYIQENYQSMNPTPGNQHDWVTSLSDELDNMDTVNDKVENKDSWLMFQDTEKCEDCDEDFDIEEEEE